MKSKSFLRIVLLTLASVSLLAESAGAEPMKVLIQEWEVPEGCLGRA